jgi:phosphatidylethanolamine-binding protein (PEBP) family uncharacterized protein
LALKVSSALFADGGTLPNSAVFNGFGLSGANISPDFTWTAGPAGTKSYVVTDVDTLGLGSGTTGAMLMFCMNGHILDQGRLTAVFAR